MRLPEHLPQGIFWATHSAFWPKGKFCKPAVFGDTAVFSPKMDSIEFTDSGAHGRIALFNYWLRCGNNEGLPLDVRHFARFKIYVFADFLLPMLSHTPGFFVGGCDAFIHKIRRISKGNPAPAYDIHGTFGGDPHELAAHFAACRIKG